MDPIASILNQALIAGLALTCIYMVGAFAIRGKDQDPVDFLIKRSASGVWMFISGFLLDLFAYLILD